jgi:uncharacterized protein (DUF169 family)
MPVPRTDLSIFAKFDFRHKPVGVKFALNKPEGIAPLDRKLAFCEILKEAFQRESPFYFGKEHEDCFGKAILGMVQEDQSLGESGIIGYKWGVFQEPRANGRLYHHNFHLGKGTVNYVLFAPFDRLTFDPDLLLIMATPEQAEIVLRASSYASGELYESKSSPVLGCSWLTTYPYMSGKINYLLTNLQTHGMKGRQAFPDGWVLISIPFNRIAEVAASLREMRWDLPEYSAGREYFLAERDRILAEAVREMKKS